jgi:hypothetical protein
LYEVAYIQAGQAAFDETMEVGVAAERHARREQALLAADVEILAPVMVRKLAMLDARHYGKLSDPQYQSEAALAMAATAQLSSGHRAAPATQAADVAAAVQVSIGATGKSSAGTTSPVSSTSPTSSGDVGNSLVPDMAVTFDRDALDRVATTRARDIERVARQLGLNSIEQVVERTRQARRAGPAVQQGTAEPGARERGGTTAHVQSDNHATDQAPFAARGGDTQLLVPREVEDRYLRVGRKFYEPSNTRVVAFEDKGDRLETRSNSEKVAAAMVAIARIRGWHEIKAGDSETFRRQVWLEAALHGMQIKGYAPPVIDKAMLAKRAEADQEAGGVVPNAHTGHAGGAKPVDTTRPAPVQMARPEATGIDRGARKPGLAQQDLEPASADLSPEQAVSTEYQRRAEAFAHRPTSDAIKEHPELAGTYAVMAAIEQKVTADNLDPQQRAIVMARVKANLVNSIERGKLPQLTIREQAATDRDHVNDRELGR